MTNLDKFYDELKSINSQHPHLRFGQFIECVFYRLKNVDERDPFYVENVDMIEIIRRCYDDGSIN